MNSILTKLAQRPRVVNIIVGLIAVLGLLSLSTMRSNFLPPEPVSFINIEVAYPGASPFEMEEEVVNKIEENLKGIKGVDRFTSNSKESFALISVEIFDSSDPDVVTQDVKNAVDKITSFPEGIEPPVVTKQEILNYTMTIGLVGDVSRLTLKDVAKSMKDELILNPELSQIQISGFPEEEIEIRLREDDLRAFGLTFDEVASAIQGSNINASGGEIETGNQNILIRLDNRKYYGFNMQDIVIKSTPEGKTVYLSDIAEVLDQFTDKPDQAYLNGEPAVFLKIFSRSEEDIISNAEYVSDYLKTFNDNLEGLNAVVVEDMSISLKDAIGTLTKNAWQGILLVLIVLGLFLNPRIAFWVALKIPVGLLGMFLLSRFYDLTINQVSLFGTIVVLGIIVDDGVVVAENIYQHFTKGKSPLKSAIDGTKEIIPAIISSLGTTALAFSLFFFLDGQLGDYFSDIAFVVCATLSIALIESLFFLPVHIARSKALSKNNKPLKITQFTNGLLLKLRDRVYDGIITRSIARPYVSLSVVLVVMIGTIYAMGSGVIKGTFFPTIDQDLITARIELPPGTDETVLKERLDYMEKKIWEVNNEYSSGRSDDEQVVRFVEKIIGPTSNQGYLNVYLLEGNSRGILSFEISDKIRSRVGPIPEATNLSFGSEAAFGKPVSIALIGTNMADLREAKNQLRNYLSEREDLKDVTDTDKTGMPELEMTISPKAKFLGLNEAIVFDQIRKGFFGLEVQSIQRGDEEIKVWIRYDEEDRRSIKDLEQVRLQLPDGSSYPLNELANFTSTTNTLEINHQNGTREIRVEADVENLLVSVPQVLAETEATILSSISDQFPNIRFTLEGEARLSAETQSSSQAPSMVILILIVTILLLNYRSFSKTIAILSMLPFAFVGVAWGSFLHGIPVSIFSILGLIALWGVLINNGLVLISTYNDYLVKGFSMADSMKEAAMSRFRPIVLTTVTTVFGLAPLLLNNSISAQFIKPTAIAIAYGLIFGMVLTLFFLPSMQLILSHFKVMYYRIIKQIKVTQPEQFDIVLQKVKDEIA